MCLDFILLFCFVLTVIDTIVDADFYRQMNYDSQLVVIYMQNIFMLANEIIQQNGK